MSAASSNHHQSIMPDIFLLRMFKYLYMKDLFSCSQVCLKWRTLVQEELDTKRNVNFETFFLGPSIWNQSPNSDNFWITQSNFKNEWTFQVCQFFSLAHFCILVCNSSFGFNSKIKMESSLRNEESRQRTTKRARLSTSETSSLISSEIPQILKIFADRDLEHVMIVGFGFIATSVDGSNTLEHENYEEGPGFGGILFPKSVHFHFKVVNLRYQDAGKIELAEHLKSLFGLSNQMNGEENESIRWLLFLTKSRKRAQPFVDQIRKAQKQLGFACSGGIPNNFLQKTSKLEIRSFFFICV